MAKKTKTKKRFRKQGPLAQHSRTANKAKKARNKSKVGRGKPKGKPPAALVTKKKRRKPRPRAKKPEPRDIGLLDAIGEVMADVEELGQEIRDWADNMDNANMSHLEKYEEVNTAADTLEEQAGNDPVTPDMGFLNEIKITHQDPTPKARGYSRGARLGHAVDLLNGIIFALETYSGDRTGPNETIANELHTELEDIEGNLQGVDFPGMYG